MGEAERKARAGIQALAQALEIVGPLTVWRGHNGSWCVSADVDDGTAHCYPSLAAACGAAIDEARNAAASVDAANDGGE